MKPVDTRIIGGGQGGGTAIDIGRAVCTELAEAERCEWLVTNGMGSFASGTVAGTQTRRYHGLLVAALNPPGARTYLVAKLDETATYDGAAYELGSNRWTSGAIAPAGYRYVTGFRLEGTVPTWTFAFADAELEKRIWMEQGAQTTYVSYRLTGGTGPVQLTLAALVNYRDFHAATHAGDWHMTLEPVPSGVRVRAFDGAVPFLLRADGATCETTHVWYRDFDLPIERSRGLEDREDHLHAATFVVSLQPGESLTVVASLEEHAPGDGDAALARQRRHEASLYAAFDTRANGSEPEWIRDLALAADQFVVNVALAGAENARSIIAGYHWFGDWGRDTMIALDGLSLATGRTEIARNILETFGRYIDGGMLPNYFPEAGRRAEYNTVDAALWYVEAVRRYVAQTHDLVLADHLYPKLVEIVTNYRDGTRYGIRQDPSDGLITAGEAGVQLTWMDAKVGDWVVTPRTGKPVEINALWYNALFTLAALSRALGHPDDSYLSMAERTREGFGRYWNAERDYCFDVLDGPDGNDTRLRPNQLLAVALPESPLAAAQQRAVVDACTRRLLTPAGLRSLADGEPGYRPTYGGTPLERDGAYHQGTVWGWLIGPWAFAHLRVYGDVAAVRARLATVASHRSAFGLGTLGEIADGEPPHAPNGCIAQAWTVAEVLRAWHATTEASETAAVTDGFARTRPALTLP